MLVKSCWQEIARSHNLASNENWKVHLHGRKVHEAYAGRGGDERWPMQRNPACLLIMAIYLKLKAVNKELVGLYWDIGRMIVERQRAEGWGKAVVEQLAARSYKRSFPA
jgi:hypothetical protein